MRKHALLIAGGQPGSVELTLEQAEHADFVVAIDGGADHLAECNIVPNLFVGDGDSASEFVMAKLASDGVEMLLAATDKDETDLELGLLQCVERGFDQITVLAAFGGDADHMLGNFGMLFHPKLTGVDISLVSETQTARAIHGTASFNNSDGETLSLIPWGGEATFTSSTGLHWPLDGLTLRPDFPRGISNRLDAGQAQVTVASGKVLAIQTHR